MARTSKKKMKMRVKLYTQRTAATLRARRLPPTSPKDLKRIAAFFKAVADRLAYLASRWQDERGYEDIKDYADDVKRQMPKGFTLERIQERPFGFTFSVGTEARYHMQASPGGHVSWSRVI